MKTLLILMLLGLSVKSYAWRESGHFTVCEVAYRNLTAVAKEAVDAITGDASFAEQCTWPDMIRKSKEWKFTYGWHFINLNDDQEYFETKNISARGDVLQAILRSSQQLSTSVLNPTEQLHQLRFLGHFVGDIHQPLHIGRKSDMGGNNVKIKWFGHTHYDYVEQLRAEPDQDCEVHEPTGECLYVKESTGKFNLHKVWDLHMIEKFMELTPLEPEQGDSPYRHKAYSTYVDQVSDRVAGHWQGSTPLEWAKESLCKRPQAFNIGKRNLGKRYYKKNMSLINERLVQGGYRLAGLLNRAFDEAVADENSQLLKKENKLRRAIENIKAGKSVKGYSLSLDACEE